MGINPILARPAQQIVAAIEGEELVVAAQGLPDAAEEVGGGAYAVLDRPAKEDELRDYERLCASGEAFVYAAMIRLMTRRIARV
jgi:hypothetical protein